jgi:hypothetical protein
MGAIAGRPTFRWLVPLGVVCAVVLIAALTAVVRNSSSAAAAPPRSATTLVAELASADTPGISGTVVESADLGLPALPSGIGGDGTAAWNQLLSGAHTLRVWSAGPTMSRVALLGSLGESDLIRNGADIWTWSSADNTASHLRLPAGAGMPGTGAPGVRGPLSSLLPTDPQHAVAMILRAIGTTTSIRTENGVTVAGRSAYQLVLSPKDTTSLVGSVRIAIDAQHRIPLRVQVFARGDGKPAFEIGFTNVSFAKPAASVFAFTPPAGAKVTQIQVPSAAQLKSKAQTLRSAPAGLRAQATVIGTGWTAILAAKLPISGLSTAPIPSTTGRPGEMRRYGGGVGGLAAILNELPRVSGAWGSGRMLKTKLLSVLVTDDGRIFAGAVEPSALTAAAGSSAGQFPTPSEPLRPSPGKPSPGQPTPNPMPGLPTPSPSHS